MLILISIAAVGIFHFISSFIPRKRKMLDIYQLEV